MLEELKWITKSLINLSFFFFFKIMSSMSAISIQNLLMKRGLIKIIVLVLWRELCNSQIKKKNHIYGDMTYYRVVKEIYKLDYYIFQIPFLNVIGLKVITKLKLIN